MQSNIIELGYSPIEKDERVEESTFYEDFVGTIADYVDEIKEEGDRKECIKCFVGSMGPDIVTFDEKAESITFSEDAKRLYFKNAYHEFMMMTLKLTLTDFATTDLKPYKLSKLIENKYDYYIYIDGSYYTLDYFMRIIAEPGKPYYFGGIVKYHF